MLQQATNENDVPMINLRGMAQDPLPHHLNEDLSGDQTISFRRTSAVSHHEKEKLNMYALELNPEDFPDGGWEAYLVLFGSFCGLIADFGIPNTLGAIEAYVSKNQLSNESLTSVSWVFTMHLAVMYVGGGFFGDLFDKHGSRKLLVAGTVCICGGLVATGELKELYQFILSFGILTALGTSLAMSPLIGVLSHWFLRKRGMACSVATVGGLVGASVFLIMLQNLYGSVGFSWAMRILALVCLTCMLISIVLVKDRKPDGELTRIDSYATDIANELSGVMGNASTSVNEKSKFDFKLMLDISLFRDIRFVTLTLAVFLSEMMTITVLTYIASSSLLFGVSELKSYLLITVMNLCGIPSRVVTGMIADRFGRFNVMVVTSLFSMIFIFALFLPSKGRLNILYAFAALFGSSSSAVLSLIGPCVGQICPASRFGKYYGLLYFCCAFLNIIGIYLTILVIGPGHQHNYQMWILVEGCLASLSVAAWIWARYTNVGFRLCKF